MSDLYIALLILVAGTLIQSFRYIPLNMIQGWSWESFSFVQGIFCYLLLPLWGVQLALPDGWLFYELFEQASFTRILTIVVAGMIWNIGTVLIERSYTFLGIGWGKALSTAVNATAGAVLGAMVLFHYFFHTHPTWELPLSVIVGMLIAWVGFVLVGAANHRKNRENDMDQDYLRLHARRAKGLTAAVAGGVMAAGLAVGIALGDDIYLGETLPVYRTMPTLFLIGIGAFVSNSVYCLIQNIRNATFSDYSVPRVWRMNIIVCLITAVMEFAPLLALSVARGYLTPMPPLKHMAYFALIALTYMFSFLWEVLMQEWRRCSYKTVKMLGWGLLVLLIGVIIPFVLVQIL